MNVESEPIEGGSVENRPETNQYEVIDKGNFNGKEEKPHLDVMPGQEWDYGDLENAVIEVPDSSRLFVEKGVHLEIITHPGAQVEVVAEDDVRIIEKEAT